MTTPQADLSKLRFCVFDLETTGGNHDKDGIIEIGLVKIDQLEIVEEKSYLIKPEIKIPDFIQKLTSIRNKDVKDSPKIEEVIEDILEFMGDRILIAHNTSFDIPFFNSVLRRLNKEELENKSICTNLMTRYLMPSMLNSNLSSLSELFDIDHGKAHRALDDARATAKLIIKYLHFFEKKGIDKINHLYYPRNRYELDKIKVKSNDSISSTMSEIKCPSLVSIKGKEGILLNCIPLDGINNNKVEEFAKDSFEQINVQMFGSFIESFFHLIMACGKTKKDFYNEIIDQVIELYDINKDQYLKNLEKIKTKKFSKKENKFNRIIVSKHLVTGQMIVIHCGNLSVRNSLVFKIKAHKKKLTQFISSRVSRGKNSTSGLPPELAAIWLTVFEDPRFAKDFLITPSDLSTQGVNEFIQIVEDFSLKQNYPYKYPESYI